MQTRTTIKLGGDWQLPHAQLLHAGLYFTRSGRYRKPCFESRARARCGPRAAPTGLVRPLRVRALRVRAHPVRWTVGHLPLDSKPTHKQTETNRA
jgi:hypothetical protein